MKKKINLIPYMLLDEIEKNLLLMATCKNYLFSFISYNSHGKRFSISYCYRKEFRYNPPIKYIIFPLTHVCKLSGKLNFLYECYLVSLSIDINAPRKFTHSVLPT